MNRRGGKKGLGKAFPDQVTRASRGINLFGGIFKRDSQSNENWTEQFLAGYSPTKDYYSNISGWRLVIAGTFMLICFFGLFIRLFHLQIVSGSYNRDLADSNRVLIKIIHAPRGIIYDRNGKVLAENNPGFRLKQDFLTRDEALQLEVKGDPKYNELEVDALRHYPLGEITAHALGYVSQITEEELKQSESKNDPANFKSGDRIGRAGVEQIYESNLRGTDGAEIIEVDAAGKTLRTLRKIDPIPGNNISLSIDSDLQQLTFNSLKAAVNTAKSCCGAAVLNNPKTGEILGLVSVPSFDANVFTNPQRSGNLASYFEDPNSPLFNRVISGAYPPGSTFKITTALSGLRSGKITGQTTVEDTGIISIGKFTYSNWFFTQHGKTEGLVDLVKALKRSNDIYFYYLGEKVGEVEMGKAAYDLGFGQRLGIDLPSEATGTIPGNDWKLKNIGDVWYPGDSLHMAIGQGFLLATPLQILTQISTVAAEGKLYKPFIVTKITRPDGSIKEKFEPKIIMEGKFTQSHLRLVKEGLMEATRPQGTAWPFVDFFVATAGKTGTAEFGDPKDRTHAWYTSFAPSDDPTIASTILIEAGGEGSTVAAPVAKKIYSWFFAINKNNLETVDPKNLNSATDAAIYGE